MPNHRPEEDARAASIVMSYFHPWTLRVSDATEHVPFAGHLRKSTESWQDAMSTWLDGNIVCEEARRYVGNFLSVHRIRPVDDDASGADNSDDMLSDEELTLSSESLLDALRTRIGGSAKKDAANNDDAYNVNDHHANSSAAVQLGQEAWGTATSIANPNLPEFSAPTDIKEILKAARASQKQDLPTGVVTSGADRQPAVRTIETATVEKVREWLAEVRNRRNSDGKLVANAEQFTVVSEVAHRVMQEIDSRAKCDGDAGEPLRKLVHGGPGTGKTHAIKLVKELFQDVLGWQQGVHFQVVAFQAVVAHLIGGDTIHHALGIPVFTDGRSSDDQLASHMTIAKRMLQCRWLIIDEISMVSSQLLALVDIKLREVIRDLERTKKTALKMQGHSEDSTCCCLVISGNSHRRPAVV